MPTFSEIQEQADTLSTEERAGLASHLLDTLPDPPLGAGDDEALRRAEEMDSGAVTPISHEQFLAEAGRG